MPLLSRLSQRCVPHSFEILFISPLRALIRQQGDANGDVATLAAAAGARGVHPWMGDIPRAVKDKSWENPNGILLITPESLESMFVHRSRELAHKFSALTAIVIDELHAYFDSPRGAQLISLLARLETRLKRPIQRIALSATLGDGLESTTDRLYAFLRPGASAQPGHKPHSLQIDPQSGEALLDIRISAALDDPRRDIADPKKEHLGPSTAQANIVEQLRGIFKAPDATKKGLIFTNSRHAAENYAQWLENSKQSPSHDNETPIGFDDGLTDESETNATDSAARNDDTNENKDERCFQPHHGSLSREAREAAEGRMRNPNVRSVLVCTTTLELGIDIGAIEEVAQIGPGPTVASLRQRLGRSGRLADLMPEARAPESKHESRQPRLHVFLREAAIDESASPLERLRLQVFQSFAQVELLRERRFEVPNMSRLDLSTLVQQILSLIHEYREEGITLGEARSILTDQGPFGTARANLYREEAKTIFDATIDRLATRHRPLIDFDHIDGVEEDAVELFLTPEGESVIGKGVIYTAFRTPIEYTVRSASRRLGSASLANGFSVGDRITFDGRAWEVSEVSHTKRVVYVRPAAAGRAAHFVGNGIPASQAIVDRMKELYATTYDDFEARIARLGQLNGVVRLLAREGRETFEQEGLARSIVPSMHKGPNLWIVPWLGIRRLNAFYLFLRWAGLPVVRHGMTLIILDRSLPAVAEAIVVSGLLREPGPDIMELVRFAGGVSSGKFDFYLNPSLRRADFARGQIEMAGVAEMLANLAGSKRVTRAERVKAR